MASASAAGKVTRRTGDGNVVPGLRETIFQRLSSASHNNEADEEEEEEEGEEEDAAPGLKVMRQSSDNVAHEKPVFASSAVDPRLCVPLKLSDIYGDSVPYTINRYLRDYQREGIRFIYKNYIRSRGCILGDDMGLGKTVQVIGFLAAVLQKTGTWEDIQNNRPQFLQSQTASKPIKPKKVFLVVAPLSVLYNWKDELETWGHFQCVVVHGLRKEEELARIKKGRIEIALTTYETLRLCLDQFNNIEWSAVVVDEAHKIKNPNSQITQAMKGLTCKIRIGLTGTILQNNLEELWCVMDWAIPGCLGSIGHFKNKFSDPIEQGQRHSATKRALATGRKAVKALVRKVYHSFLRRTKALIKEQMPKKDDRVVYCSLTDFQQTVYQTVLDTEDVSLMLRSAEKCDCHSGRPRRRCCYKTNSEGVAVKELYFSYLAILRKVSNHVALLQSTAGTSKKQEKYVGDICTKVFQNFPDFVQRCKTEAFEALSDPMYSGKMKVLQKLLRHYLKKRDKVLLFSLSTKLLDVLESYCMAEGLDYSRLDGNTKSKERLQLVKEFNSSSHINLCLVSTMAGGLGLNFVGANVVVLFDPTWNPANDLQAIDRAYRIGQCRDVTVLRLISLGTVEEVIYLRQVYKQQLQSSVVGKESARRYFEAVQGHGVHKGELFGIQNLFRLQTQGTCLTRQILDREGQVESGVMTARTHTGEEKEEEAKGVSKSGDSSHADASRWNNQALKESTDASKVSKGVLDFSSGSEEDEDEQGVKKKKSNPLAAESNGAGSPATGAGQMSLLQHGFSRLLEGVQGKPELEEGDSSPCIEASTSEEDVEDQKRKSPSNGICKSSSTRSRAVSLLKSGKNFWDSSGSDREDKRIKDGGRQEQVSLIKKSDDAERNSNLKKTVQKVQKIHRFMGDSDESEDLDIESKKGPKCAPLHPHDRGGNRGTGGPDRNKKRQSASARDKAKSKHTDKIETFTSSEDEHTPVKKPSTGSSLKSPQMERSRVGFAKSATERQAGLNKSATFTNLKSQTSPASKERGGSIDSVLGGVQEVMYTHSNQRVVGESRAEKLISRAAVRDVFERNMYSQLPANHLLGTQESLSSTPPDSPICPPADIPEVPSVDHPVTFCNKSVHHTRHTTFIFGETPNAIRRRQLEKMAANLNFSSVHQFAAEILRSKSTQRITWLRQYYTSQNHPDLADAVTRTFPQPDSAQTSSSTATSLTSTTKGGKEVPKTKRRPQHTLNNQEAPQNNGTQKKCLKKRNHVRVLDEKQKTQQKNVVEPLGDVSSFEPEEPEEQEETVRSARGHERTKRGSVSGSGAVGAGGGLGLDRASSSGLGSGETAAASLRRSDRDTPSSPDLSHGTSPMLSKPTAQGREQELKLSSRTCEVSQGWQEKPSASCSALTDLIGDTSILDDLWKPKSRGGQQRVTTKTHQTLSSKSAPSSSRDPHNNNGSVGPMDSLSSPKTDTAPSHQAKKSKSSCKDFWDILNEGNEESINRLTDPAEVQRVCINTNLASRKKSGEEESKSLWKTNDKFRWKK